MRPEVEAIVMGRPKLAEVVVSSIGVLLIAGACASSGDGLSGAVVLATPDEAQAILPAHDASPPGNAPDRPGGSFGYTRYVFEEVGDRVITTLVEGPLGEQVRVPVSYQGLRDLLASGGDDPGLHLAQGDLTTLVSQLDSVRASTERYRDVEVAIADGFFQMTDEVPQHGRPLHQPRPER